MANLDIEVLIVGADARSEYDRVAQFIREAVAASASGKQWSLKVRQQPMRAIVPEHILSANNFR